MRYFFGFVLTISLFVTCAAEEEGVETTNAADSLAVVMQEWKDWAESSDEGLWEGDSSHKVNLELLQTYGGEEEIDPPFFYPEAFALQGDTFFVSDGSTQKLVAFNSQGEVLWSTEGPGEGPGYFNGVAQLDVCGEIISVVNLNSARIDFFSTSGEWLESVPVMSAYDVQMLNDSVLVAVKQTSPEGCIMLLSTDGDTLSSYGQWEEHPEAWASNRDLHCTVLDSELLVLTSYYSDRVEIYDIEAESRLANFCRTLPVEIEKPDYSTAGLFILNTISLDVFIGPEGMINVLLRPFSPEKTFNPGSGSADLRIVDRFDFQGRYLDSYVIPAPASQVIYSNGKLYMICESDCSLRSFAVSVGK